MQREPFASGSVVRSVLPPSFHAVERAAPSLGGVLSRGWGHTRREHAAALHRFHHQACTQSERLVARAAAMTCDAVPASHLAGGGRGAGRTGVRRTAHAYPHVALASPLSNGSVVRGELPTQQRRHRHSANEDSSAGGFAHNNSAPASVRSRAYAVAVAHQEEMEVGRSPEARASSRAGGSAHSGAIVSRRPASGAQEAHSVAQRRVVARPATDGVHQGGAKARAPACGPVARARSAAGRLRSRPAHGGAAGHSKRGVRLRHANRASRREHASSTEHLMHHARAVTAGVSGWLWPADEASLVLPADTRHEVVSHDAGAPANARDMLVPLLCVALCGCRSRGATLVASHGVTRGRGCVRAATARFLPRCLPHLTA